MAEVSSWQKYIRPGESQDGPPGWTNHPNGVTLLGFASTSPALSTCRDPKNTILVHPIDGGLTALGEQNIIKPTWADLKALKLHLHLVSLVLTIHQPWRKQQQPTVWQAAATL